MRILVVEDEQDLNRILAKTLTAEGYSVDACFDGVEALDYLEGAEYDAIVLDVMMPRLDGFNLAKMIRQIDRQIPILFLTARSSLDDLVTGFKLGGNDYLKKPFEMEELMVRIQALAHRPISVPRNPSDLGD